MIVGTTPCRLVRQRHPRAAGLALSGLFVTAVRSIGGAISIVAFAACSASPTRVNGPSPQAPLELKRWEVWSGDWTLKGTAKDTPTGPSYQVDWRMSGRWILDGWFLDVRSVYKGLGPEAHFVEISWYDSVKKEHGFHGYTNDGSTWTAHATFGDRSVVESGTAILPDGKSIRFRNSWTFSPDWMSVSGKQEAEMDGVPFTAFSVTGTRTVP